MDIGRMKHVVDGNDLIIFLFFIAYMEVRKQRIPS